jgi:hypothetical protein
MSWVGFEPTIPAFKREKTFHALDRAATVIDCQPNASGKICASTWQIHKENTVLWVRMSMERCGNFEGTIAFIFHGLKSRPSKKRAEAGDKLSPQENQALCSLSFLLRRRDQSTVPRFHHFQYHTDSSGSACRLLLLASSLDYSSTLKIEAVYFSEIFDSFRTTRYYNPKHHILQSPLWQP